MSYGYATSRWHGMAVSDRTEERERQDTEDLKRRAWQEMGVLVIDPEDVNDDWERQALINAADKAYGRRRKRNG